MSLEHETKLLWSWDKNNILISPIGKEAKKDEISSFFKQQSVYVFPAQSTDIEPPVFDSNTEIVHWDGSQWEVLSNYNPNTGMITVWNTDDPTISERVEPNSIQQGHTIIEPSTIYDEWDGVQWVTNIVNQLAGEISKKINLVKKRTEELMIAGVSYNSKTFEINTRMQLAMNAIFNGNEITGAVTWPLSCHSKTGEKETFSSYTEFELFYKAYVQKIINVSQTEANLIDSILACTTLTELNAIVDSR